MFYWILNTRQTTFKMREENPKTKESKDCQYLLFDNMMLLWEGLAWEG